MSASSYSGSGLIDSPNYSQLLGFIEFVEGYKGLTQGSVPGQLYYDSVGIPTIGYGFALINNDGSVNVNTLAAVLDGLVLNGQPYVSGQVNDNVFVAASQGSSPLTQGQVLDYFSWLVKTYGNRSTPIGELQGFLTDALQQFFAGNGSTLYDNGIYLLPVEGDTHENISFAFSPTNRANAEAVLSNLVAGATLFENATGNGNELVISGYSPDLYQTIENEGKVDGNGDVIGAPAGSAQWAALVAQYYNGFTGHVSTSAGVTDGDPAQTWFVLRYDTSSPTRGYLESEVFGLNGGLPNSTALAYEDYEMLTEHRGTIMSFEATNGIDPDFPGDNPTVGKNIGFAFGDIQAAQAQSNGPFWYPGPNATLPSALQSVANVSDLSLFEILNPEADQIISELNSTYSSVIPQIGNATEIGDGGSFNVASTNIFVAPSEADIEAGFATPNQMDVDAAVPDPGPYGSLEAGANHIILGTGSGDVLTGGLGNDLIVAGSGSETLNAGAGADTLIGGSGNDILNAGAGTDVFDLDFTQNQTPALAVETIDDTTGNGSLYVDGNKLGTGILTASGNLTWTDGSYEYQFIPGSQIASSDLIGATVGELDLSPDVGELKITPTASNTSPAGTIDILGFNIAQAESSGFLGITLPAQQLSIVGGAWHDPPAVFPAGSEQAYTFSIDAPSATAQTVTFTLTGASASDFEAQVGNTIEQLNSDGTFTVTLVAGQTNVSFGLIDITPDNGTSDIADGATLSLTASVPNPANPSGSPIESSPLSITYTPEAQDTTSASTPGDVITGTLSGGVMIYQGDGGDDYISAGQGPNEILAQNSGSDSIIGGSGDNTVYGGSGNDVIDLNGSNDLVSLGDGFNTVNGSSSGEDSIYGHGGTSIINADGGTDLIFGRNGTNQIYADSVTSLQDAIQAANAGAATGLQGDLLTVGDGDNTIVGGSNDDLFILGSGNDVVVMGSGNSSLFGGIQTIDASANWSLTTTANNVIQFNNIDFNAEGFNWSGPQPYNGNYEYQGPLDGLGNDTIFGGSGDEYIELPNGNDYVDLGSGNSSVYAGMGSDTIIAGTGADLISGGGGTEYVYGGSGKDTLTGGDGNNTIIGGSGDSTITSASGPTPTYAGATLEQNYVFGGSGNDVIYGSAGNDTLVAGSGNTTIWGQSGKEYMVGGSGNDLLSAGQSAGATVMAGGSGTDSLYGGIDSSASYYLYGGDGSDLIVGGSGQNIIYAGDGGTSNAPTSVFGSSTDSSSQTTIYGGLGIDSLQGGAGSTVIYAGDGGTTGAPDSIFAGSGNTTIYGGLGTDVIQGGSGTDVLYAGDGGTDAAPTKVIADTGVATLYGGAGDDVLQDTNGGSDLIVAGTGTDTLFGTGNDTLVTGTGTDVVQTYGDGVSIQIGSGFSDDEVYAFGATENVDFGSGIDPTDFTGGVDMDSEGNNYLVLGGDGGEVSLENAFTGALGSMTFADSGSISLQQLMVDAFGTDQVYTMGDSGDNFVVGVQGDDSLSTGNYDDTVSSWGDNTTITGDAYSGYGDDIYSGGASADIIGSSGYDTIVGAGTADSIAASTGVMQATVSGANSVVTAGALADTITASGSDDTLIGSNGNTTFVVNDPTTVIQVPAGEGVDTVIASVSYTAPTNVDVLTLTGTANIVGTGNSANDLLTGGAGSDTLIAGSGVDTLRGGTGNTTFVVGSSSDVVQDTSTSASNTLEASISYSLPTNVNILVVTGTAAVVGTANGGTDTLISNDAADTLIGGTGSDTFVIDNPGVVLEDSSTSANNVAESLVSYTLPTNVNTLVLTGTADLVGAANGANDTLVSNSGLDTLVGGSGNDLFIVNNPGDVLLNLTASDTVEMASSYSLPAGIDTLVLTGSAGVVITGNGGNDSMTANAGPDTLIAGTAIDTFVGGTGSDTFILDSSADVVRQTSVEGSVVESSASYSLPENVDVLMLTGSTGIEGTANTGDDSLVGGAGSDTLVGGSGTDTLVAGAGLATLVGGSGSDTFVVDNSGDFIEDTASGATNTLISSVSYSMPTDVNSLELTGEGALSATTNGGNDLITANAGADTLTATSGADTLVAGSGTDTMIAGTGNDVFVLNSSSDVVTVTALYGVDTIESSASVSLPSNVNILQLTGSSGLVASANSGNDSITANAGGDTLVAGSGIDTLVSGSAPDTFVGSSGATLYVIDNSGDVIESISGAAGNAVDSSVSFTLPSGIDSLTLTGSDDLLAQGNDDTANTLTANSGDDTLVSGTAVTTFEGGDGDDTFIVNNPQDVVVASPSATNTVLSSVSYTLPDNVTTLLLTGSANLLAAGNTEADSIVGNSGADTLIAGTGNDTLVAGSGPATLIGGVGNDTFVIDSSDDVIEDTVTGEQNTVIASVTVTLPGNFTTLELSGTGDLTGTANSTSDLIVGGSGADTLVAGAGTDTLIAGSAANTLVGGSGNTTFLVNNAGDVIEGASATASNSLLSSVTYTAPANVNSLTLTGPDDIAGIGNAGNDVLTGGEGSDTLVAGSGTDTLIGGTGNTTFEVDSGSDVVLDTSTTATNTLLSSVGYTLPANVGALVLTGTADLLGAANSGGDTLIANAGVDTLVGAGGSALFVVDNSADVVQEASDTARDSVESSVDFTLPSNVDVLILTGSQYPNEPAPTGTANSANDTLVSGTGVYDLVGGTGNDLFVVNSSGDSVVQANAGSVDTIVASASFSLPTNVDTIELTGSAALTATGNAAADLIEGNAGADTLVSGTGVDTLVGGGGSNLFVIDNSGDIIDEAHGGVSDTVQSWVSYSLPTNVAEVALEGTANLVGTANGANDTLISNAGVDTLVGGSGHDVFVVNNASDVLQDVTAGDTIESSVGYTLPSGATTLVLTGSGGITGTGNSAADTLVSEGIDDTLVAGSATDTLIGESGATDFVVNSALDVVVESSGSAQDSITSSVSYSLPTNVDVLSLNGSVELVGTGNEDAANTLIGSAGNNILNGTALSNTFYADSGSDTIEAGPGANWVYLGSGGTTYQPTEVLGNDSQTSDLTDNYIYGGTGVSELYGGPGYNYIQGGSGTEDIYAGSGSNLIYGGSGGTSSVPDYIYGNASGTTQATESTIYGGTGYEIIRGGPGSDLIYAGQGTGDDTIYSGTGFDSIYGSAGSLLVDNSSGLSLLEAGGGAETLDGIGADTLVGGTGTDLLYASGSSSLSTVYEFDSGFGQATIGQTSSTNDTLLFGSGIAPTALTIGQSVVGGNFSGDNIALTINDGTGSILIPGGFMPGTVSDVEFTGSGPESLAAFMTTYVQGTQSIPYGDSQSVLSTNSDAAIVNGGSDSDYFVWAFGGDDTITDDFDTSNIYAYGSNDTITGSFIWAGGTGDSITLLGTGSVSMAGASDTVTATGSNDTFVVGQASDVITVSPGGTGDSVDSLVSYTLPSNVQTLILDSSVGGLVGFSDAQGGVLVADGADDTLTGGSGSDTLSAQGSDDVLVGGAGVETYILRYSNDTVQFGSGSASLSVVETEFSYTLPTQADSLVLLGNDQAGVANSANDLLTANGTYDTLVAGSGDDTLVAVSTTAPDTLEAGSGSDTFVINYGGDIVTSLSSGGSYSIESSVSYSLPVYANSLILTGTASLVATANAGQDTITANSGNDTLTFDQGFGQDEVLNAQNGDVLEFGSGISQSSLTFTALPGTGGAPPSLEISGDGGAVTVQGGLIPGALSGISFAGGAPVSIAQLVAPNGVASVAGADGNLILVGTADYSVTGGAGDDTIVAWGGGDTLNAGSGGALIYAAGADDSVTGSSAADTLEALAGSDTLIGGSGVESFVVGASTDVIENSITTNQDTLFSSVSYTAPQNVNVLVLIGTAAIEGTANSASDVIVGDSGNDTLVAGAAVDTLIGGPGPTTFLVNNANDVLMDTAGGAGVVVATTSYSLPNGINTLVLTSGSSGWVGVGNDGADLLRTDAGYGSLIAGGGNDTLYSDAQYDALIGGAGEDYIESTEGFDSLVGGTGVDTFASSFEYDRVYIDNPEDSISELGEYDTVYSSVSYTIPSDLSVRGFSGFTFELTGSADLMVTDDSRLADTLVGTAGDTLVGGSGENTFSDGLGYGNGVIGPVTMIGGDLSNYFEVNNQSDVEIAPAGSYDTIAASVSLTLPSNVDTLLIVGGSIIGTGNAADDTLIGEGSEVIAGSGNDSLVGNGYTTMVAGSGNDTLSPYDDSDVMVFNPGFGTAEVLSAPQAVSGPLVEFGSGITASDLTASAVLGSDGLPGLLISDGAETVTLNGALAGKPYQFEFNGGSALNIGQFLSQVNVTSSTVAGASGNAILEGTPSADIQGGSGDDSIYAVGAADTVLGGGGTQILEALGNSESLVGGDGSYSMLAYGLSDTLASGVNAESDSVYGNYDEIVSGSGDDTAQAFGNYDLILSGSGSDIAGVSGSYDTVVSGSAAGSTPTETAYGTGDFLEGGAGGDTLTAYGTGDTLMSGSGVQTLTSENGQTVFVVSNGSDSIREEDSSAADTAYSSVGISLPSYVDTLILTGSSNIAGTGNSANDWLAGNAGNDTLTAGSGVDTLVAGSGVDTLVGGTKANLFIVNNSGDTVQVGSSHGADTIESSASYSLPANVATLTLTGSAALAATGNTLSNVITANSGNDTLTAGSGTATLIGGSGNDTFVINKTADVIDDTSTGSANTLVSSVSYTLPTDVQYLTLTGTAALAGTGNGLDDLIVGNTGKDTLTGGTGIAVLEGGTAGSDLLQDSKNQAALVGGGGTSTLTGGAYSDFYGAGKVSEKITTGATANVVAINMGDGADTLQPVSGASNVLSLGAGMDTEELYFTKTSNNLILSDSSGDKITFTNWFSGSSDQDFVTLQVVEIASASYNPDGTDPLRNQALEEFNFKTLVSEFTAAGSPSDWQLSKGMPSAEITGSASEAYGGDLAYYFGLNGDLTGMDLSAADSTLTNSSFATGLQTIDSWSSISGGGGTLLEPDAVSRAPIGTVTSTPLASNGGAGVTDASASLGSSSIAATAAPSPSSAESSGASAGQRTESPGHSTATPRQGITHDRLIGSPDASLPADPEPRRFLDPVQLGWLGTDGAWGDLDESVVGSVESAVDSESPLDEGWVGVTGPVRRYRGDLTGGMRAGMRLG